ncbi:exocyst complex component Sec5-domain-containing protein [Lipomyces kononenkoae]|uniref:Exocyst complex component Sec5-domain-containing protein n=1 Tax=Lipomyces kononenkoae TaxID=34357 RepID=A0ACC3T6D8_LIPKO
MAELDTVFEYYGLRDPFPTFWADSSVQEHQFALRLSDYFNSSDDAKTDKRTGGNGRDARALQRDFDMFVTMKSTLDTAYREMKKDFLQEFKDWGVVVIEQLIDEANIKAARIMKPIMDNKTRGDRLKATLSLIEKNRYLFDLPAALSESINRGDHDSLVRDYRRGMALTEEIRTLPHSAELSDFLVQQRRVIERIWGEVEVVVEGYKRSIWKQLSQTRPDDNYILYISILLELGVEDNPIWVWLQTLVDNSKRQMEEAFDDLNSSLQILRKDVFNASPTSMDVMAGYVLKAIKSRKVDGDKNMRDLPEIVRMWVTMNEVIEEVTKYFGKQIALFWECASGFLDGRTQSILPMGPNGQSKVHLKLSGEEEAKIRSDGRELVEIYASRVADFFVQSGADSEVKAATIKRAKSMDSEYDSQATTPQEEQKIMSMRNASVTSLSASARLANSLKTDRIAEAQRQIDKPPVTLVSQQPSAAPPAPGSERNFELYAFLPPNANAIGTTFYLSQILNTLGSVASELAGLSISSRHIDVLRTMMSTVRERCVSAACLSWQQDAKRFNMMEDWRPTSTRKCTMIPALFLEYQSVVLDGLQRLVFIPGAEKKSKVVVILPPSSNLVSNIKTQFANSIFLALNGLVKDAVASDRRMNDINGSTGQLGVPSSMVDNDPGTLLPPIELRLVLMICNIAEMNASIVNTLFERFSTLFSIQLTDNSNIIGDAMKQLDEQLFSTYMKKKRGIFTTIIRAGVLKSGIRWSELGKPTDVSPYICQALLQLVLVHMQVASVGPMLVTRVITDLLHHIVNTILESFRQIDKFSLGGMLQATIDVEFVNQKMTSYSTPEIENLYQACYATIQDATDRSRMEVDVMTRQLEEMKKLLLKCHKQSRLEFLCFKEEMRTKV